MASSLLCLLHVRHATRAVTPHQHGKSPVPEVCRRGREVALDSCRFGFVFGSFIDRSESSQVMKSQQPEGFTLRSRSGTAGYMFRRIAGAVHRPVFAWNANTSDTKAKELYLSERLHDICWKLTASSWILRGQAAYNSLVRAGVCYSAVKRLHRQLVAQCVASQRHGGDGCPYLGICCEYNRRCNLVRCSTCISGSVVLRPGI